MSSHCQLTTSTGNLWVVINFQLIESELPCLLPWPSGACKWPDDWGCAISFYWGTCTPYTSYTLPHIDEERGRGGGRLCHKNCPCQGKLLVPSVDRILTLLLLVRVTVGAVAGAGAGAEACLLFVCLTDLLLFILISGSNTPTLKEHGLCTAQSSRCFRFLH